VLQTFCEGPNNGGPSLAKFHEGPDPRTLAESTPMVMYMHCISSALDTQTFMLAKLYEND